MYQKLLIENLEIYTFIGAYEAERKKKQKIILNLEILLKTNLKFNTDNLDDIVDYSQFRRIILDTVCKKNFNLIETLALTILHKVKNNSQVKGIKLKITKPDIFEDCSVSFEISDCL